MTIFDNGLLFWATLYICMKRAVHAGASVHPVQRLPSARRRQLSGSCPPRGASFHRNNWSAVDGRRLVRVFGRVPSRFSGWRRWQRPQQQRNMDLLVRTLWASFSWFRQI